MTKLGQIVTLLILSLVASPAPAKSATVASITDGDTFRTTTGERIRIAGIDAPETHDDKARCAIEIERGRVATGALARLIEGREVTIERVGRSYNRTVAKVRRGQMDVAAELVRQRVARPWPQRSPKPDWCGVQDK